MIEYRVGAGEEYATIQSAVDQIPDILQEDITITILAGEYNEDVLVQNKRGFRIYLTSETKNASDVTVDSITFDCVWSLARAQYISFKKENGVKFNLTAYGSVDYCDFETVDKAIYYFSSNGSVTGCRFNGGDTCIYMDAGTTVKIRESNTIDLINKPTYFAVSKASIGFKLKGIIMPVGTYDKTLDGGIVL